MKTKRFFCALLALVMVLVLLPTVAAQADDDFVQIATYEQLKAFADLVNGGDTGCNAVLTADITCSDETWTPIGLSGYTYQGKFDGQGHSITGLSNADVTYSGYVVAIGLFGDVGGSAVIQNVAVKNCDLTFDSGSSDAMVYAGAIAAANGGTVENCYCTGTVRVASGGSYVGGIVGTNSGTVQNCYNTGTVGAACTDRHGTVYVGGVIGQNSDSGKVKNCYSTGTVSAESKVDYAKVYVGGVVGSHNGETVQDCHNTGAVVGSGAHLHVGGVVGYSYKKIQDCYNTGAVSGSGCEAVGGVVGYTSSTVQTCLNTGMISGSGDHPYVGGIAGSNSYGSVENCLNTGEISGAETYAGGVVGENFGGAVKYCLSVGTVPGTARGGVVGWCVNNASLATSIENCYYLNTAASAAIGTVGTATVTNVAALTAEQLKSIANCVGFSADNWTEGMFYPVLKDFSAEIHLYANNDEDLVLQRFICAYVPTAFANPFTYADHVFTGWNTQADGNGVPCAEDDEITLLPGNALTLYAQWKSAPIEIATYEQLKAFAARVNAGEYGLDAKITSDFTCSTATDWTPICPDGDHPYTGTFDGGKHVITGLKFNQTITSDATQLQRWYTGLFGVIGTGGTVQDLYLKDCSIQASVSAPFFNLYEGAVAGRNFGTITACGVFGEGEIRGVRTGGDMSANAFVGGIAGYNNGIISDSCFIGTVNVQSNASCKGFSPAEIGGIAGRNTSYGNRGAIENCFHSGSVIASGGDLVSVRTDVGGIAGTNYAELRNCRHNGSVQGAESISSLNNSIGGVAGTNGAQGIITYCYARSAVEELEGGSGLLYLGGVVGANSGGSTSDCFFDTTLAPDTDAIGYFGAGAFSDVIGLASEAFADESNFSGWENFDTNWVMGVDQPELIALSVPVHLYANSDEDVVKVHNIPVCTPTKFANPFTYEKHDFTGWNTEADGEGDPYDETHAFTLLPGDELTLHAQWEGKLVEYPLWVGGVQVTSENMDDVLGDGTVRFEVTDEGENVLTLTNANITGVYEEAITERTYNVYSRDTGFALTVKPIGENSLSGAKDAICLAGTLQLTGDGTLTAEASNTGISVRYGITVDGPTVKASGINYGVWTGGRTLSVKGTSKLTAEATGGMAIFAEAISIDDGLAITTPAGGYIDTVLEIKKTVYDRNGVEATEVVIEPAYTITFRNADGTELQSGPVAVGETPVYAGETPTKAPTVEKLYTFAGWKDAEGTVYTDALPAVEGEATYTAVYTESDRAYDGPSWVWTGYTKAVATFTAKDDATFTQTVTAEGEAITNAVTTQPTCTDKGERTYTATVTFLNTTYTDKAYEPIDEKGHDWDEPTYEWKEIPGGYTCTATRVCGNDEKHVETETVGATYAVIEAPQPYVDGLGRYTSNAFINEAFEVQTKDVVIPMLRVTFVCGVSNVLDDYVIEDGEKLYKVNITVENLPDGVLNVDSMQLFLTYDHDLLTFVRAEGIADWTTNDYKDRLSAVWASDTDVEVKDGDVVLTLYFAATGEPDPGEVTALLFTNGALGDPCAMSYVNEGRVTELEAATVNGGIVFEAPLYGDANADGVITSADAALILRAVVGLSELTPRGALNADVDGDGEVTAADAVAILRWLVGLIEQLPVE